VRFRHHPHHQGGTVTIPSTTVAVPADFGSWPA